MLKIQAIKAAWKARGLTTFEVRVNNRILNNTVDSGVIPVDINKNEVFIHKPVYDVFFKFCRGMLWVLQ